MPKNKPLLPDHLSDYKPLGGEITCVFCKGTAQAIEFSDGTYGLTHSVPECAEFTAMDPVTFLRENRKAIQKLKDGKLVN